MTAPTLDQNGSVGFSTYAAVLRIAVVRRILLLGTLIRVPLWAANIVVVLHVVTHLGRTYAEAGVVTMVLAVSLAVSSPWRGRLLDRLGLRRTVGPSVLVGAVCWSIAPWVGYWPFVVLVGVAGLFTVPSFSIIRQVLISAVPEHQRTTALSVDSVATELTFMLGPVLGVLAATYLPTPVALLLCQLTVLAGCVALWAADPPLVGVHDELAPVGGRVPLRSWLSPAVALVLAAALTSTVVLTGEDLGTVAALREWGQATSIGWVLALWGAGSAIGGLVYGALHRHPPATVLLALLAGSTALVALAEGRTSFTVLLFVSGLFCAPSITATVSDLTRLVPAHVRGEAMGWHGSALTLGSALGAPALGAAMDRGGWSWGFLAAGAAGLVIAVIGLAYEGLRRRVFVESVTAPTR